MEEKINFSYVLNGDHALMMNACERYGSVSGCDENCPVFLVGECEFQKENERLFGIN